MRPAAGQLIRRPDLGHAQEPRRQAQDRLQGRQVGSRRYG